jgi:hypothetical protein
MLAKWAITNLFWIEIRTHDSDFMYEVALNVTVRDLAREVIVNSNLNAMESMREK